MLNIFKRISSKSVMDTKKMRYSSSFLFKVITFFYRFFFLLLESIKKTSSWPHFYDSFNDGFSCNMFNFDRQRKLWQNSVFFVLRFEIDVHYLLLLKFKRMVLHLFHLLYIIQQKSTDCWSSLPLIEIKTKTNCL